MLAALVYISLARPLLRLVACCLALALFAHGRRWRAWLEGALEVGEGEARVATALGAAEGRPHHIIARGAAAHRRATYTRGRTHARTRTHERSRSSTRIYARVGGARTQSPNPLIRRAAPSPRHPLALQARLRLLPQLLLRGRAERSRASGCAGRPPATIASATAAATAASAVAVAVASAAVAAATLLLLLLLLPS